MLNAAVNRKEGDLKAVLGGAVKLDASTSTGPEQDGSSLHWTMSFTQAYAASPLGSPRGPAKRRRQPRKIHPAKVSETLVEYIDVPSQFWTHDWSNDPMTTKLTHRLTLQALAAFL